MPTVALLMYLITSLLIHL